MTNEEKNLNEKLENLQSRPASINRSYALAQKKLKYRLMHSDSTPRMLIDRKKDSVDVLPPDLPKHSEAIQIQRTLSHEESLLLMKLKFLASPLSNKASEHSSTWQRFSSLSDIWRPLIIASVLIGCSSMVYLAATLVMAMELAKLAFNLNHILRGSRTLGPLYLVIDLCHSILVISFTIVLCMVANGVGSLTVMSLVGIYSALGLISIQTVCTLVTLGTSVYTKIVAFRRKRRITALVTEINKLLALNNRNDNVPSRTPAPSSLQKVILQITPKAFGTSKLSTNSIMPNALTGESIQQLNFAKRFTRSNS